MTRSLVYLSFCVAVLPNVSLAQRKPANDPQAMAYAAQAVVAITRGMSLSDITLSGSATWRVGPDDEIGTATLLASGTGESRVDIALPTGTRSEIRDASSGTPLGKWTTPNDTTGRFAFHNCLTDAAWFFPAFSSLSQFSNPSFIFSYFGQEQHDGVLAQHIQVYQVAPVGSRKSPLPKLSKMDFYLDPASYLPLAAVFSVHTDRDMNTNILTEVRFGNYQAVNGIQLPFHIQRVLNGTVILDIEVTDVVFNTGLSHSLFNVQ